MGSVSQHGLLIILIIREILSRLMAMSKRQYGYRTGRQLLDAYMLRITCVVRKGTANGEGYGCEDSLLLTRNVLHP